LHRIVEGVIVTAMPKDKIRIVIAGCAGGRGSWFTSQAAAHPDFVLVGLVDRLPDAAGVVATELGLKRAKIHRSTEEALAATEFDALLVATPDAEHAGTAIPALEAGKHVYVEKPLATTLEDCLRMTEVDESAGGKTMVGFNLRFAPFYRRMRDLSRDGHVGRILTIQADEFYYGGRTYFRRWNRLRSVGGGLWITKACHDFDILSWIAGEPPTRVAAQASLSHYVPRSEAATRCSRCPIERKCPDSALPQLERQPEFARPVSVQLGQGHLRPRDRAGHLWRGHRLGLHAQRRGCVHGPRPHRGRDRGHHPRIPGLTGHPVLAEAP
jgi:predicted dehydrogenase